MGKLISKEPSNEVDPELIKHLQTKTLEDLNDSI